MSRSAANYMTRTYSVNPRKLAIVPAGVFNRSYIETTRETSVRERLNISDHTPCTLFLGRIQPYKGLEKFISVWKSTMPKDCMFVIAGQPSTEDFADKLRTIIDGDQRIICEFRWIPDEHIRSYLELADVVVLPFENIMNSGSAVLATSFKRRVILPSNEFLKELYGEHPQVAYLYQTEDELMDVLLKWGTQRYREEAVVAFDAFIEQYAWDKVVAPVRDFFTAKTR